MLGSYGGMLGIKTGYTDPAGYCFVGAAKRNGIELVSVVLGADDGSDRFSETRKLLDWGFRHAKKRKIVSADATMGVVEVSDGVEPTICVRPQKELSLTVCDTGKGVTTQVSLPAAIAAPVQAGQEVGAVQVAQSGVVVATVPLVADKDVDVQLPPPAQAPATSTAASATPSLWQRIATVVAGFGRLLGI
jgi:D-alanyl-D-alanine carboxypeptidase (penicillin-binding protein 5/6)